MSLLHEENNLLGKLISWLRFWKHRDREFSIGVVIKSNDQNDQIEVTFKEE